MPMTPTKTKSSKKPVHHKPGKKEKPAVGAIEEQSLKDLAKKYCKPLPHDEQEERKESLQDEFGLEDLSELNSKELWDAVEEFESYLVIEKASVLHKKGLSSVWKLFNFVTSSEKTFLAHFPQVLKRAGIEKITAKFDPLNATYRSVIKTDDRRVASSGAQAIRWAKHKKQTPDTVVDFEGGVESWAKEWQDHCRKEKEAAGGKKKPKKTTASAGLAKLRKELKSGDKALLMVKMVGTALVSEGSCVLPKTGKKQWPQIKAAVAKMKPAKSKSAKA